MKEKESNILKHIFPSKEIKSFNNKMITVKPIPVDRISDALDILAPLLNPSNKTMLANDLAKMVAEKALCLLPLCVDTPINEIPVLVLPDVLEAVIDFNFPNEKLKKWVSLIKKFQSMRGVIKGS